MSSRAEYLQATRHPWACLLFVLPLLLMYESCVLWLKAVPADTFRNGADVWIRGLLGSAGLSQLYWAPVLLACILVVWSWWRWRDRPRTSLDVWLGMAVESGIFALGLWGLCQGLVPLLDELGVRLEWQAVEVEPAVQRIISFIGAGIYEETLFRLVLFSLLFGVLRLVDVPRLPALALAAVISALLFAAAHNLGPHGESFQPFVFLFRTVAGLYFALIYYLRGFGIAVGAHAGYDVLVGVLVEL